ncbi:endo-1,3(4)-beta-glucanase-like protein [Flagelloscypha sp. PMI_526]|nr:endo-1,3(4)-beta-glucanase-like protein [Flagelloscypha sp. PMI_526]
MHAPVILLLFFSFVPLVHCNHSKRWKRTAKVVGHSFYEFFQFQPILDPTHGRVTYVDEHAAKALNLTFAHEDTFILRAEDKSVWTTGRPSVRLMSKKQFTEHVAIFDVRHMPQGCGTWPAIWETAEDGWPEKGELDILGVNDVSPNAATLHTTPGCTMPADRTMLGTAKQDDCNWQVNFNAGCGVAMTTNKSYGPDFNRNGGGWFAVHRTSSFIRVWFWPRHSSRVPHEVSCATDQQRVNPDNWGTPQADFPSNPGCDLKSKFGPNNIIINLTLCGDWAGNTFNANGCSGTCVDLVDNHPEAFTKAYFDIASINVYE